MASELPSSRNRPVRRFVIDAICVTVVGVAGLVERWRSKGYTLKHAVLIPDQKLALVGWRSVAAALPHLFITVLWMSGRWYFRGSRKLQTPQLNRPAPAGGSGW